MPKKRSAPFVADCSYWSSARRKVKHFLGRQIVTRCASFNLADRGTAFRSSRLRNGRDYRFTGFNFGFSVRRGTHRAVRRLECDWSSETPLEVLYAGGRGERRRGRAAACSQCVL